MRDTHWHSNSMADLSCNDVILSWMYQGVIIIYSRVPTARYMQYCNYVDYMQYCNYCNRRLYAVHLTFLCMFNTFKMPDRANFCAYTRQLTQIESTYILHGRRTTFWHTEPAASPGWCLLQFPGCSDLDVELVEQHNALDGGHRVYSNIISNNKNRFSLHMWHNQLLQVQKQAL
jgi:hypothetical protein